MKNCTLIATLPSVTNIELVRNVVSHPLVQGVRFNTGSTATFITPQMLLNELKTLVDNYGKDLWIDLKGRQLKVTKWADTRYECIEVNHNISVESLDGAKIKLRGSDWLEVAHIDANKIYLKHPPKTVVGAGQSINLQAKGLKIDGYLTEKDKEFLKISKDLSIRNFMASFVEQPQDITEITDIVGTNCTIGAKIESKKGIQNLSVIKRETPFEHLGGINLVAARDDLFIELQENPYIIFSALQKIIGTVNSSICASRIFLSLEHNQKPTFQDFCDLESMYAMGYRSFMLCDDIVNFAFDRAIKSWEEFLLG